MDRNGSPSELDIRSNRVMTQPIIIPTQHSDFKITPMLLLRAMRRRIRIILILGLLLGTAIAVGVWSYLPPPVPSAASKLYMPQKQQGIVFAHPDPPMHRDTQIALIRSRLVMNAALRDEKVAELAIVRNQSDPVVWLSKQISVNFPHGREIMQISMSSSNGEDAKKIVESVTDSYLSEVVGNTKKLREERLQALRKTAADARELLRRRQTNMEQKLKDVGTTVPENVALQQRLAHEQKAAVESQLISLRTDLFRRQAELQLLETNKTTPAIPTAEAIDQHIISDPGVQAMRVKISLLTTMLRNYEETAVNYQQMPAYTSKKQELESTESALAKLRNDLRERYLKDTRDRGLVAQNDRITGLKQQIDFQEQHIKLLENELDRRTAGIQDLNKANFHLEAEQIEIEQAKGLYSQIASKITALETEQDADPSVMLMEPAAIIPVNPDARKLQFSAAGLLAGLGMVALLFGLLELRNRRVDNETAVSDDVGLLLVGTVPRPPSRLAQKTSSKRDRWSMILEDAMDSNRTMLLHSENSIHCKVLVVTSAEGGEGKTAFSTQLAASLGRAGSKTLLIDGDLRLPTAHKVFGLPIEPGLSDILHGKIEPDEAIHETVAANVYMIPAGKADQRTIAAIARGDIQYLFDQLRDSFDYIIVDTSPVLPVPYTYDLARHADGVVMAMLQGRSRTTKVREACTKLKRVGANLIGAVLNGTSRESYGYGSRYLGASVTTTVPEGVH